MTKQIYTQYADIRKQIAELEEQRRAIEERVLNEVYEDTKELKTKSLVTEVGKFTRSEFQEWAFSENLQKEEAKVKEEVAVMLERIKEKKEWAKLHGQAKLVKITERLSFSPVKVK